MAQSFSLNEVVVKADPVVKSATAKKAVKKSIASLTAIEPVTYPIPWTPKKKALVGLSVLGVLCVGYYAYKRSKK